MRSWPGQPHPLGAHWDGRGTTFALACANATAARLCLFDDVGSSKATHEIILSHHTHGVWHAYLPEVRPGQLYGYRVSGPWAPAEGFSFNAAKLLVDPYARALAGGLDWNGPVLGALGGEPDPRDSAPCAPRSVVVDPSFPWGDDRAPRTPWSRTLIYECHLKGLTELHPEVPEAQRGRYLGVASEPVLAHLRELGVTAVELLPVHHAVSEKELVARGLTNYWGYNSLGFFAPDARFATGDRGEQVAEFKTLVRALHQAGIEVLLDVVYNHTAEGGVDGPTLCWRGLDDRNAYQRHPDAPAAYADYTGCGNTFNASDPRGSQLILDSLRYWVSEMHVDGFRFDLAPALARRSDGEMDLTGFFSMIAQDPLLAEVKLIAEPWDLGSDGYRLGGFPAEWSEWNDGYRDTVRRFWRGDPGMLGPFASAISGSAGVFEDGDRTPAAGINYVASHDGFTIRDMVSYEAKHNEDNGEGSRDGSDDNYSRNWGTEGPTDSEEIEHLRQRVARSLIATLALSQGVPMLLHGDEIGRSQRGNNNPYCQDNPIAWMDWDLDSEAHDLLEFTRRVFALRMSSPLLRRTRFFAGEVDPEFGERDVVWLRADGQAMEPPDWEAGDARVLGMLIPREPNPEEDAEGHLVAAETLLLIFNASERALRFGLPARPHPGVWRRTLCSAGSVERRLRGAKVRVPAHSVSLLSYQVPR